MRYEVLVIFFALMAAGSAYWYYMLSPATLELEPTPSMPTYAQNPPSTACTVATTSATVTTTTATTSTTASTTTTTLFDWSSLDRVKVDWFKPDKCRHTLLGNMNKVLVEIPEDRVEGTWGVMPKGRFTFSCDGGEGIPADRVGYRGGGSVEPHQPLEGEYRLSVRCGRNSAIEDILSCETLDVYLNMNGLNVTRFKGQEIDPVEFEKLPTPPTTTTIRNNPFLDRFRGQGYRKLEMHIKYMCPTCVPAVIHGITYEPGVKSKSLSYKQNISYIIYNPESVDVERLMILAGAGGEVEFIDDYEF